MKAIKFNHNTRKWEPYELPTGSLLALKSRDIDLVIACANCGQLTGYKESRISNSIRNVYGYAYRVCRECKLKELTEFWEIKNNEPGRNTQA